MNRLNKLALAVCFAVPAGLASTAAVAQSTDGYHSMQVFPVVVDSATFTQRFTFKNPNALPLTIQPRYFPGTGTAQATSIDCPTFSVPANKTVVITSLRTMCPSLAAGSQFGFLHTSETNAENLPYAAFSRVSNFAGNGFSIEGFPAHTFTSADTVVTGIRRLAAAAGQPSFQTNCFLGNLNDLTPAAVPVSSSVHYTLYNSAGSSIGEGTVAMVPGKLTRILDVFSVAAAGDYNDAQIVFDELSTDEPALMTFCTVQDNTSFGADFRIGKQEYGFSGVAAEALPNGAVGGQDDHVARDSVTEADLLGRSFEIGTGVNSNTHVVYFRHPDNIQCEIINRSTGVRALSTYGLEMRMLDQNGTVVIGGNNVTGWGEVYLGDKTDRNDGTNTRYSIEVEDNESNTGVTRPYRLRCQSGSGHTLGDLVRYKEAVGRF